MDRVGGDIRSYWALRADARAYDDVLTVMAGEADAARIAQMQARAAAARVNSG